MRRRLVGAAAGLALVLATASVHARIPTTPRAQRGQAFVPRPQLAKALSFGFDAVVSDFYWLQAVQVVGSTPQDPSAHATLLGRLIDVVTTLDPWVDHPYRVAAVWLTDSEKSVRTANRLLERGIAHHPDEWRDYFYLGFNHFFYLQENARAADRLEQAAALPGSPAYLPRLVARLRSESGGLEAAALFLNQLIREAPDEASRAAYQGALDEIEIEFRARHLDRARVLYQQRSGRDIGAVEDLLVPPHGVLPVLPDAEPSSLPPALRRGSGWELDPDTGRIQSDYYGSRYEVIFNPWHRERNRRWRAEREGREESAGHGS